MAGYGLIGEHLGHSYSPRIHALLGDYPYALIELAPEALKGFLRNNDLAGFNVTIPYKQAVLPFMRALSPEAREIGAVNTVLRLPDGGYYGENTDYYGFQRLLGDASPFKGKKALVLGSGGASRTVRAVLADAGCAPVVTISRQGEDNYTNLSRHADAKVIVNATPVGMYPNVDASPVDLALFPRCRLALDLIYNPMRTRFLLQAEALGIPCRNGLLMLCAQAERAARAFGVYAAGADASPRLAQAVARQTRSLALIGMPGSGKTTVGRILARLSGRMFMDTDDIITARAGMPIPQFFARYGEGAFRALETSVLQEAAKESARVIATGGGVVTIAQNRDILRQNCAVVGLSRPLEALPLEGRPISQKEGAAALYAARAPLYACWSEKIYQNDNAEATARRIMEDWL